MSGKDVVRYDNELNQVSFRGWEALEQNLFFMIVAKMHDRDTQTVVFSTDDLRDFIDYAGKNGKRWELLLTRVAKKVGSMPYIEQTDSRIAVMMLFQTFTIDLKARTLTVKVSENYRYVINKLRANFTQFELEEFAGLRSTYSKTLYRLLKQWRAVGRREFTVEEFRAYLGIPKSYDAYKITEKVLGPVAEEMPSCFAGFDVSTVRSHRRGRPIEKYVFTWRPEKTEGSQWVEGKYEGLKRPESEAAKARRRAVDGAERAERLRRASERRVEDDRRVSLARADIAAYKAAHDGLSPHEWYRRYGNATPEDVHAMDGATGGDPTDEPVTLFD